jgi:hypothetical protein
LYGVDVPPNQIVQEVRVGWSNPDSHNKHILSIFQPRPVGLLWEPRLSLGSRFITPDGPLRQLKLESGKSASGVAEGERVDFPTDGGQRLAVGLVVRPLVLGRGDVPQFRTAAIALLLATTASAAPPATPKKPATDTHHGVTVTDNYRWLEEWDSKGVK